MSFLTPIIPPPQINRGNSSQTGKLAQLLSDPSSPNTRWLVSIGNKGVSEECYEHDFSAAGADTVKPRNNSKQKRSSSSSTSSASEEAETNAGAPVVDDKKVSFSAQSSEQDESSSQQEAPGSGLRKRSAREQRSRRRQAHMDTVSSNGDGKRSNRSGNNGRSNKRPRIGGGVGDDEVIKIRMLTGTLILYKGPGRRRAEFLRRI